MLASAPPLALISVTARPDALALAVKLALEITAHVAVSIAPLIDAGSVLPASQHLALIAAGSLDVAVYINPYQRAAAAGLAANAWPVPCIKVSPLFGFSFHTSQPPSVRVHSASANALSAANMNMRSVMMRYMLTSRASKRAEYG